ncbi:MAG: hypothetical protein P8188_03050 [Gemmatimonadota bacterium]
MKMPLSTWCRASLLFALLTGVACGDDPTAPGIEPEIVNDTDSFSYQIRDLRNVWGSWDYTWQNTGTSATVSHATNAGATGTATLTVRDADGTQVYSAPLASSGEPVTSPAGAPGAWTVTVTYAGYTNDQVNFELSKQ